MADSASLTQDVTQLRKSALELAAALVAAGGMDSDPMLEGVTPSASRAIPRVLGRTEDLPEAAKELRDAAKAALSAMDAPPPGSSVLAVPEDLSRPLVVYGCFKPGELGWPLIEHLCDAKPIVLDGFCIRRRDGLALLARREGFRTEAFVLTPTDPAALYDVICKYEPKAQYSWITLEVDGEPANVLLGTEPDNGSEHGPMASWSAASDPAFTGGMRTVRSLYEQAQRRDRSDPLRLYEMEAAYLLLWSIVERYTALRFGPHLDPTKRISLLDEDPVFRAAGQASATTRVEPVYDSRRPTKAPLSFDDGPGSYWYQLRSNLSHRGKSSGSDEERLDQATSGLWRTMRTLLTGHFPGIDIEEPPPRPPFRPAPPVHTRSGPSVELVGLALRRLELALEGDEARRAVTLYHARFTGARFEAAGRTVTATGPVDPEPNRLTIEDLLAPSLLSAPLTPEQMVSILDMGEQIESLFIQLGPDRPLADAEAYDPALPSPTFQAAEGLYSLLRGVQGIGRTRATKLLHRKRPQLLPIWDSVVAAALGYGRANDWLIMQALASTPSVHLRLMELRDILDGTDEAQWAGALSDLRLIDIVVWMRASGAHPVAADLIVTDLDDAVNSPRARQ